MFGWGWNGVGQVSNGTIADTVLRPTRTATLANAVAVSADGAHTVAIRA